MIQTRQDLEKKLRDLLAQWRQEGVPTRWKLQKVFEDVIQERSGSDVPGLWESPPVMLTATLDDGWGHGLQIIELCAQAAGLTVLSLGLLKEKEVIVAACAEHRPDLLGLTVLQFDSEPALNYITRRLPSQTRLIAGGPPFQIDPELADRSGVHFIARNVADFLEFILNFTGKTSSD
jgi:methylmalonyl-CoA mutase cobalamin-binding subunit